MLQFLQIVMNVPALVNLLKIDRFAKPMLRAFSLDPDDMLKTAEDLQQDQQQQQAAMQQQLEMDAKVKGLEAQIEQQQVKLKASLDERLSIGEQRRDLEVQKVLKMLEMGVDPGQPSDFSDLSVLIKEEMAQVRQRLLQNQQMEGMSGAPEQLPMAGSPPVAGRAANPRSKQNVAAPERVLEATNAARTGQISPSGNPGAAI
jgi:hypothetical protein